MDINKDLDNIDISGTISSYLQ